MVTIKNKEKNIPQLSLNTPSYLELCLHDKNVLYTENTMLMSFDIKFIRRDQKQHSNGEACRASLMCFWSSLINLISKTLTWFSMCHASLENLKAQTASASENQKTVLSELAESELCILM